ncbi:MAG TPA: hypothetical protein VMO26_17865 [Vicinamibacterales bacterium]|nr:hypothetical protein [Vicinamibacterales bacterium]
MRTPADSVRIVTRRFHGLANLAVNAMSDDLFGMTDRILEQIMTFQHGPTVDDRTLIACGMK